MSDDCCVYRDDSDGDQASIYKAKIITARKIHRCSECLRQIGEGERYEVVDALWEGAWSHIKTCVTCVRMRDDVYCKGSVIEHGRLRTDAWEALGIDIITGETKGD